MLSTQEMQSLQQNLKDVVCKVCIHNSVDGNCALWSLEECPISSHLTRLIVDTIDDFMKERASKVSS